MYCKWFIAVYTVLKRIVLIVAKCIVNIIYTEYTKKILHVLIVAKCIVNVKKYLNDETIEKY